MAYLTKEEWAQAKAEYIAQKDNACNHTYIVFDEESSIDRSYPVQVSAATQEAATLHASKVYRGYSQECMAVGCDIPVKLDKPVEFYTGHGISGAVPLLEETTESDVFD